VNEPAETLTSQSHAPSEAPVPTPAGQPTHPSPGSERKSKEWRQPAREWRDGSHSSPEAPLPNGENDEEEEKALEHLRRVIEQYHQSQQSDSKPPGP
jgi:hypothetical protein